MDHPIFIQGLDMIQHFRIANIDGRGIADIHPLNAVFIVGTDQHFPLCCQGQSFHDL